MSHITLRGWCDIILILQGPTEDKSDDTKHSFNEELECVFHHFPKYHMKNLLRDFNAKVGAENIFKSKIGNESFHEMSNESRASQEHSVPTS
jgi:hypothetical protein